MDPLPNVEEDPIVKTTTIVGGEQAVTPKKVTSGLGG